MSSLSWHTSLRPNRLGLSSNIASQRHARDPRVYQIGILTSLILAGSAGLGFGIAPTDVAIHVGTALLTQWLCTRAYGLPRFDPRSPLISALSLTLLLRTDSILLQALASTIAIASKFVLRLENRHIFNPTNLASIVLLMSGAPVWVSPGQWGSTATLAFVLGCLGLFVTHRSERSDVTFAFLTAYVALIFGRAVWLGDPWEIPLHQLQNGGLFIFAFFMISDPKTTPNARTGRVVHACLVALLAVYIQFGLFRQNGILWALAICTLWIPILNSIFPGPSYQWTSTFPELNSSQRRNS